MFGASSEPASVMEFGFKHITAVTTNSFFQLRQHAPHPTLSRRRLSRYSRPIVASWVHYCGSLLIGSPKKTTDKLQRVLNAAARIVSNTRKYCRGLSQYRQSMLHWLDVDDQVQFRVSIQVFKCKHRTYDSSLCE